MDFIDKQIEYIEEDDEEDFEQFDDASNVPKKNPNQSKLFVGTNQNGLIITIDISGLLDEPNVESDDEYDPKMALMNKFEEEKVPDVDFNDMDESTDNMKLLNKLQKQQKEDARRK